MAKTLIFGYFGYGIAKIAKNNFFFENRAPLRTRDYHALTSCKKSKKSLEPFSVTFGDGLTNCNVINDLLNVRDLRLFIVQLFELFEVEVVYIGVTSF